MIGGPADRGSVTLPWEFVSDAPRAAWIDRFVMHTRALGIRAELTSPLAIRADTRFGGAPLADAARDASRDIVRTPPQRQG